MSEEKLMPQLTLKAIFLGIALSMSLAGANAYLGLFAGLTVSASIPAAVISMAILKLFKESNILENNIVQTAASAGESIAAGVIFTLPALIILGYWDVFEYWWVSVIAGLGGLLGVLFTVPLRRSLIVEEQLRYPEGTATAEVLKIGVSGAQGARYLGIAAVLGALAKLAETGLRLWPGATQTATYLGSSSAIAYVGINLSPALISVGFIVGLNIAILVFIGGALSWYLAIPIYSAFFLSTDTALITSFSEGANPSDLAYSIWTSKIRYLGVGAMLVGGIGALISMRGTLLSGIKSGLNSKHISEALHYDHRQHDMPMSLVLWTIVIFLVPIFFLYQSIVDSFGVAITMTFIMVITGFLFSSVAAYMAGLVGSSNNPISGITIATILFTSLLLFWLMGGDSVAGPAAAIMVGAVVCSAAAIAGDNLQDLKAGYLLGATPWRQQCMQAVGVISAVLVMAPILNLLLRAYGIGAPSLEQPNALLAPQATLMASVTEGVFGSGLPWGMVLIGAVIGIVIIAIDHTLKTRGSSWRAPVLAVAVGIYLPLQLSTAILVGGLLAYMANRSHRVNGTDGASLKNGTLFASGLITGEALIGILMAIPIVVTGNPNVIALSVELPGVVGLLVTFAIAFYLYKVSIRSKPTI